ncbi:ligase-associated DNA damage response endonuclease PdeM [Ruegeria sp. R14_0]|uniref:ligase-associated DNA damage response endonuclease PdeM n=1 Tax=Ruegeria sp. R14_0 TaxID=2821100 RepID=UPI001ADC95D0|nr:ligase-associated DNA damage response endonuclease PdeM [Ruegeria sp. R14_0]MBO9444339.1 ligase-associated DNA damage response endonuclease PdeM [Ruegeria sp. R14_0]
MNELPFTFAGQDLRALGSGALWWPDRALLCVSDLHLGKSERMARRGGPALPPYDSRDTLTRLSADIDRTGAQTIICLGDSFDDLDALAALGTSEKQTLTTLQAGRRWVWIEGNHDPGPIDLGGTHLSEYTAGPMVFRHIALPGAAGEVSGHYHPKTRLKARGRVITRPAFLLDDARLILPAYGTYTGGLLTSDNTLTQLMNDGAMAILTGPHPHIIPMPR